MLSRTWIVTVTFQLLTLALFVALAGAGWPGAPSRCAYEFICYCEPPSGHFVRQPFNTWSNLACIPVALGIAWDSERRAAGPLDSRLPRLGRAFSLATSSQGLASMFFHGSLTEWGAVLDALSIFIVVGLILAVNLLRLRALTSGQVGLAVAAVVSLALAYRLFIAPVMAPLVLLAALGIVTSEWRARKAEGQRSRHEFRWAFGLFLAGASAWALSLLPGWPLCSERLPWGHALWHVLAAGSTGAFWLHARAMLQRTTRDTVTL